MAGRSSSGEGRAPVRRFFETHDVVGASVRLTAGSAVAMLVLTVVTFRVPAGAPTGLVAMTAGAANVLAVAAGLGVLLWVLATLQRGVAAERLADEVTAYLGTVRPSADS